MGLKFRLMACVAFVAAGPQLFGQGVGSEFRVNTYTPGMQLDPSVSSAADGGFVVAWYGEGASDDAGAFAKRFSSSGSALGDDFQLSGSSATSPARVRVSSLANGSFLAGWQQSSAVPPLKIRLFDASGVGGNESALTGLAYNVGLLSIDTDGVDRFVTAWSSAPGEDGSGGGLFGRIVSSNGDLVGGQFQVNSTTSSDQSQPSVAVGTSGGFVVSWTSTGQDGNGRSIVAQRFAAGGFHTGPEFAVNTYTAGDQFESAAAISSSGAFVVVWTSAAQDGNDSGVFGQRFDSSGQRLGAEFQVNTYTTKRQASPAVAMDSNGNFVVSWQSDRGRTIGVFGQRYRADGSPLESEFRVPDAVVHDSAPSVSLADDGEFVVTWQRAAGAYTDIWARRFQFGPSVTVESPSEHGAAWPVGTNQVVEVVHTLGGSGHIDIDLSRDGGDTWENLRQGLGADTATGGEHFGATTASYPWSVTGPETANALVRVRSSTDANLSDVSNAPFIIGQPPPTVPTVSISDVIVSEGDTAAVAVCEVTLSAASSETTSVAWATGTIGGAVAGVDYSASSGTVVFEAGETLRTLTVDVVGDSIDEGTESFYVNLQDASGAVITDGQGRVTIADDDPPPALSINDAAITEPDTDSRAATFTVSLSAASGRQVLVSFATGTGGTAVANGDYSAKSGSIKFAPGQTAKTFKVLVAADATDEANETFFVNLAAALNATIADGQGQGTIVDSDVTPAGVPALTVSNASAVEGHSGTVPLAFTVTLSEVSASTVTATYGTGAAGTASSGVDYQAKSGSLTFTPGQTVKTVNVLAVGDTIDEPTETMYFNLTSAGNATISDGQGKGTIVNDDAP